ncbi:MAG: histidine utilization repressor [Desulfobulbaceae bacterium S3730MH12]|nr:MAG: histidine utilization repressor [Desulfobulbaceae bacterium S5133MH15]OEU55631.1 MAG: histidine utilization repressor [Desulfobulbaceae bacterium S3730MH12]OEU83715.1 MAG: histidine utilization repressor [Desulfobulbaceae bacterium C00003063]
MSHTPLYRKIKNFILDKINKGEWEVGKKILSEAELGVLFHASRMTVNRALRELASKGRVIRKQGNGTFVAAVKPQSALIEIISIAEDIRKSGAEYSCDVHLLCEEKATPDLANAMELQPYATVFHSIITHKQDGIPMQMADRFINPVIAPEYLSQDFTKITPSAYLLKIAPVNKIKHTVQALLPAAWVRNLLDINEAEPCLALSRTTWSGEVVATRSIFYYPGSRYSLGGTFTTSDTGIFQIV